MIIPGPEIEERKRDTIKQHGNQLQARLHTATFKNGAKSQSRNNIDKNLCFYQCYHLRPEDFKKYSRYHPGHTSQRYSKIPERQFSLTHPVSPFPGKEDIYPVWKSDKEGNNGQQYNYCQFRHW